VAAVDCGTNTLRLLIADVADGTLERRAKASAIVRLGEGVDERHAFSQAALDRTFATCRDFADVIRDHAVDRVRFVATSATRDVSNREAFLDGVTDVLGVRPVVVTGSDEARLAFLGATAWLPGPAGLEPPYLVADIGGGSTELVLGGTGDETYAVQAASSVDVGSVRVTERHLQGDPPTEPEVERATADVDAALRQAAAEVPIGSARTLVGVAGSVTTIGAHALGHVAYRSDDIHGAVVPADQVLRACADLLAMSRSARLDLGFMQPGRADVIGGGALIMARLLLLLRERESAVDSLVLSESDLLDGIALDMSER
jgi:exopolyphosphatase/guanosine-5'-triphosphate,3'-diphosphate pyrophosphatase